MITYNDIHVHDLIKFTIHMHKFTLVSFCHHSYQNYIIGMEMKLEGP